MPTFLKMPDGKILVAEHIVGHSVSGATLTVKRSSDISSSPYAFTAQGNAGALNLKQQLADTLNGIQKTVIVDPALVSDPYLLSVSPTSFDFTTATITIKGKNFNAATIGYIYIEDAAGGLDSNGWQMKCTFVDSETMTAVFYSFGDNGGGQLIYYLDANSTTSNVISCSNPSGTNITIP